MQHAEDKNVKFYEVNLKVRDITWKTDMKSYASYTKYGFSWFRTGPMH